MGSSLNRQLWISFSVILASVAAGVVAFYLLTGHIDTAVIAIIADKALVEKQTGALGVVAQLKQQAPQAALYEAAMNKLLPTQDNLIGFSQWISGIAAQDKVAADVAFQGGATMVPGSTGGQMNFSLTVDGSINNVIAFLTDVESKTPGYLVHLSSFNLTSQNGTFRLTSQGSVFYRSS